MVNLLTIRPPLFVKALKIDLLDFNNSSLETNIEKHYRHTLTPRYSYNLYHFINGVKIMQ